MRDSNAGVESTASTTGSRPVGLAASTTIHCLTGCSIGEILGVAIGVEVGLQPLYTALLATTLAFISGFALTLIPMARAGQSIRESFRMVWLGEVVSISTMEVVMNSVDYMAGGMTAGSMWTGQFWSAMLLAIAAGYAAGFPVNYWMLNKGIKSKCH
jgi:hypothetical protein